MKRIFIFSLMMAVAGVAMAQKFSISGKVTDDAGETLVGASVMVEGTYVGTTTNSKGEYLLNGLESGKYNLVVSFIGFEDHKDALNLDNNKKVSVILKSKAYMSDEVIVAASRAKTNTPVAQTTLTRDKIAKMNTSVDIPYQLELTPSVVATSETGTGMGYTNMRIRGTDMTRINVSMNGVPMNDGESQGVYFVNMPDFTASVNSVQIQRGVGTSTNGAASFGASVNFQTLTIEPKPYAHISSSIGSFNTFKESVAAGTGLINNKFAFDVRASKLNSDGYIKRGFADHESFYMSGTYYGEKDMLKFVSVLGKQQTGITWWGVPDYMIDTDRTFNPAGEYVDDNGETQFYDGQTDNYWQNHYQLMYSRELNRYFNINATVHATTGKGYYQQYKAGEDFADYGLPSDTLVGASDLIRQKWLDNVFYGAVANLNYHKGKIDATFGVAGNNYDGDHFGRIKWAKYNNGIPHDYEWYNNKGTKMDLSSFLKMQYSITEELSVFGDIQVRNIDYKIEGPDDDLVDLDQSHQWTFVNPKVGVNYQLDQSNRLYLSYAMANREPARADIKEATKNGGTQMPTHETLNDVELGYQLRKAKFVVGANVYYMLYKNQLVQTGELNAVGYSIMTNVDNSYRAGIELIGGFKFNDYFSWNANLTYSQNKIQDYVEYAWHDAGYLAKELGETNISYSPEWIAASNITANITEDWSLNLITKYVGEQYIDNTSSEDRKLDDYLINNVSLNYNHKLEKGPILNLQFMVNNILDEKYISNAYGGNWYEGSGANEVEKSWIYYYPQAGRNFMVKIALTF